MFSHLLQYEFLQNAFISGMLIGIIAPLLGVFVVIRRLSLIADALSHVTLAGIAGSLLLSKKFLFFAGLNPIFLGVGASVTGALLIERLRSIFKHYEELSIPIILSSGIGLSVIFISLADGFNTDLFNYLFGSVTAVSRTDLLLIVFVTIIVIGTVFFFYKEWFLLSFDEEYAVASGLSVRGLHFLFIIVVALVIAVSMRIVGILLVSSLMTIPVAASIRIAKGFKQVVVLSIIFGEASVILGLIVSYYLDLAPGGTIVIFSVLILLIALLWKKTTRRFTS
ncbi:metal ABC transporter permease [Bacillus carboniphilus]|uniref:Metal ABC transporter permease n=1 Tax=Bacillus carboniphilus TaxID=86663 RepID=A0ABY9JX45_9BACI|nr:metal ABC transporter permease [Bacillus carboniphilus]WLR43962.1 metal ABC transporter permease [Bacillus carboniphilus]